MKHEPATHLFHELPFGATCQVSKHHVHGYHEDVSAYDTRVLIVKVVRDDTYLLIAGKMTNALVVDTGETAYISGSLGVIMGGYNGSTR